MKTIDIELAILKDFNFKQNIIVTDVTEFSGLVNTESDVMILSKSGYATSIEIKVSKADLKADLKKRYMKRIYQSEHPDNPNSGIMSEHWRKYFFTDIKYRYYAVPEKLKETALELIPDWCGLIVAENKHELLGVKCKIVREAPVLYPVKWSDEKIIHLLKLGCMRIYSLKQLIKNKGYGNN